MQWEYNESLVGEDWFSLHIRRITTTLTDKIPITTPRYKRMDAIIIKIIIHTLRFLTLIPFPESFW